ADGQAIGQFPDAVPDNGAISRINPEGIFPALFLANPQTGLVVPLSWGMSSWSGLHDNAQVVIAALERQHHA
ncbi:conjugal transfer protein TraF, partial [Candidatus Saccharibacteria bacterium]|nr:conjugal transfer protein TraF [Candidatus Saccharibacteria bacterium]